MILTESLRFIRTTQKVNWHPGSTETNEKHDTIDRPLWRSSKAGVAFAFVDEALLAHVDFVLEHQFEELFVGQLMATGFLQARS